MSSIVIQIVLIIVAVILAVMVPILFLQNRKTEYAMRRTLELLLDPNKVRVFDAKKVIDDVLSDTIQRITENFNQMAQVLDQQNVRAANMEKRLGVQNKILVQTADVSAERIATMTNTLENMVSKFGEILSKEQWNSITKLSAEFSAGVTKLLKELETRAASINDIATGVTTTFDKWTETGRKLSDDLGQNITNNTNQFNMWAISIKGLGEELGSMSDDVVQKLNELKTTAHDSESILANNDKLLANQLSNMENWTDQSKKLLTAQVNALADTANQVGANVRLAEAGIETGTDKINLSTDKMMATANAMKETFGVIANEIMAIRKTFQSEVEEFANTVVASLAAARSATADTMSHANEITTRFKTDVLPMLSNMNNTVQSLEVAQERMQPLSDIIHRLEIALPELSNQSGLMTDNLTRKITDMADKINTMTSAASSAIAGIGDSTMLLEKLSGESRQQMIELMADYAKAANSMRDLSGNIESLRTAAITEPIKIVPINPAMTTGKTTAPRIKIPVQDFFQQIEGIMEKLHELSVDLTRSIGADIPESVMDKYTGGDRAIFSKWFAKMIKKADKKRVQALIKNDPVFRTQVAQFVQGFAKILAGAERTDNREMVSAAILQTDLGIMYQALRACL